MLLSLFSSALAGLVAAGGVPHVARQAPNSISCTTLLTGTLSMVSQPSSPEQTLGVLDFGPLTGGIWTQAEEFTFRNCTSSSMGYTPSSVIHYG
jgi:hypothetical protein